MTDFIVPKNSDRVLSRLVEYSGIKNVQIVSAKQGIYRGNPAFNLKEEKDEPIGTSILGTPIYTDLVLMGVTYTDNLTGKPVTLENDRYVGSTNSKAPPEGVGNGIGSSFYMRLDTVLITVTKPQRVIKTEIQGRDGTVKEYIGADDARITINGIITGNNGVYPKDEVARLRAWLEAPVTKPVVSWWLGNLGVDNIVVENHSIPQVQGGYSYQMFSIDAVSDFPVELKITSNV